MTFIEYIRYRIEHQNNEGRSTTSYQRRLVEIMEFNICRINELNNGNDIYDFLVGRSEKMLKSMENFVLAYRAYCRMKKIEYEHVKIKNREWRKTNGGNVCQTATRKQ